MENKRIRRDFWSLGGGKGRRVGIVAVAGEVLVRMLGYPGAKVAGVALNVETGAIDVLLEGRDFPVVQPGSRVTRMHGEYRVYTKGRGRRRVVRVCANGREVPLQF